MKIVLFVVSALVAVSAFGTSIFASNAVHQIYGAVLWLIAALLFTGSAIVGAIHQAADKVVKNLPRPVPAPAGDGPPAIEGKRGKLDDLVGHKFKWE